MLDKLFAALALAGLIAFVAVLVVYVAEPDLIIVAIIVLVMATIDFVLLNRRKPGSDDG